MILLKCYFKRSGLQLKEKVMKNNFQALRTSMLCENKRVLYCNTERDSITTTNTGTQNNQQSINSLKKTSSSSSLNGYLAEQLISRMRRVSRVSFASPEGSENRKFLIKYVSPKKVFQEIQQFKQKEKLKKQQDEFTLTYHQKSDVKIPLSQAQQKIHDLTLINQNLRITVNHLQQQLFIYKQQIEKMLQEIKENKILINQLEETIVHKDDQITYLISEAHHLKETNLRQKQERALKLSIQRVFNEKAIPNSSFTNMAILKAKQQSALLRKRLKQTQREREKMIKEFNQQKQEQIAKLKDHFTKSIQYYKKALIKLTSKQKQELFQPKILELLQSLDKK